MMRAVPIAFLSIVGLPALWVFWAIVLHGTGLFWCSGVKGCHVSWYQSFHDSAIWVAWVASGALLALCVVGIIKVVRNG